MLVFLKTLNIISEALPVTSQAPDGSRPMQLATSSTGSVTEASRQLRSRASPLLGLRWIWRMQTRSCGGVHTAGVWWSLQHVKADDVLRIK